MTRERDRGGVNRLDVADEAAPLDQLETHETFHRVGVVLDRCMEGEADSGRLEMDDVGATIDDGRPVEVPGDSVAVPDPAAEEAVDRIDQLVLAQQFQCPLGEPMTRRARSVNRSTASKGPCTATTPSDRVAMVTESIGASDGNSRNAGVSSSLASERASVGSVIAVDGTWSNVRESPISGTLPGMPRFARRSAAKYRVGEPMRRR